MRACTVGLVFVLITMPAKADVFSMDPGLTSVEFITVGNAGNASDMRYNLSVRPEGYGHVDYAYQMGKYEVTAAQYTEFLNAVAKTDTYGLYYEGMASNPYPYAGCRIQRSGSPGSYSYSVPSDWANRPVNLVCWGDAARFCNWLTNGQPTTGVQNLSTTEDGSYFLNGAMTDAELMAVTRRENARYVIPSEDEWYKAAYHKNDGVTGNYWDFPTATNATPSSVLTVPDSGNNANYNYSVGDPYCRTDVGSFGNSDSPYGTFDQGGNVWEWTEASFLGANRENRGGCYFSYEGPDGSIGNMKASGYGYSTPTRMEAFIGFRVAEVPEPATLSLLALGGLAILKRRKGA